MRVVVMRSFLEAGVPVLTRMPMPAAQRRSIIGGD